MLALGREVLGRRPAPPVRPDRRAHLRPRGRGLRRGGEEGALVPAGARRWSDIGVFSPEEFTGGRTPPPAMGATRILQEGGHQFDFVDSATSDLARYRLLVLPDDIAVGPELGAEAARATCQAAGALHRVASLRARRGRHASSRCRSASHVKGEAPFSPDFIRARARPGEGAAQRRARRLPAGAGGRAAGRREVLADVVVPYFNRTYQHYSSHRHTPSSGRIGVPGRRPQRPHRSTSRTRSSRSTARTRRAGASSSS